jgi:hypothetical protein
MVLYKIENRQLTRPQWVDVPDETRDFDAWLFRQGYPRGYTLRRGIVREETRAQAMAAIAALGKPSAPLPGYRPNFRALVK